MTATFRVNPTAISSGATQITGIGDDLSSRAGTIQSPSPMMMGLFMAPILSFVLPTLTSALQGSVAGSGKGYQVLGGRLENSAKGYRDMEDEGAKLASTITKDLA
ncbi:hypothetical protein ACSDQ9_12395 [Aestuariimicrobium soli]|uniref:hypothetical protein n=1 Tax=Aestuariimicrobium soli TaxID=2035834 RepID=UPI003EBD43B9